MHRSVYETSIQCTHKKHTYRETALNCKHKSPIATTHTGEKRVQVAAVAKAHFKPALFPYKLPGLLMRGKTPEKLKQVVFCYLPRHCFDRLLAHTAFFHNRAPFFFFSGKLVHVRVRFTFSDVFHGIFFLSVCFRYFVVAKRFFFCIFFSKFIRGSADVMTDETRENFRDATFHIMVSFCWKYDGLYFFSLCSFERNV